MSLDDLGLIPTIKKYINKFRKQTDIEVSLQIRGQKKSLSSSHEVTIFRLIQEALNNIYKHAQATTARVSLEFSQKYINLMIIDDGKGFIKKEVQSNKFGLVML